MNAWVTDMNHLDNYLDFPYLASGNYTITVQFWWGMEDVRDYTLKIYSKQNVTITQMTAVQLANQKEYIRTNAIQKGIASLNYYEIDNSEMVFN